MPLVKGTDLTPAARKEVLAAFVYRWTHDNHQRESAWATAPGRPTIPLVSDDEWLAAHAFYVTNGGRLDGRYGFCEPRYLADHK